MTTAEVKECTRLLLRGVTTMRENLAAQPFQRVDVISSCRDNGILLIFIYYHYYYYCNKLKI
jgi:hypothetical protein